MPFALLLAMQAAGMVVDYYGTQRQKEIGRMGQKVEQAGIETNIAMTRAEAEDASLRSMENLRQTIGSQAAIMAARGTQAGSGSALAVRNESVKAYQDDERTRRMNLLAKEATLRAGGVLSGLHQYASETRLGQAMTKRFMENIPMSSFIKPSATNTSGSTNSREGFGFKSV